MNRESKFKLWHRPTKTMYYYEPMWGNFGAGDGWIGAIESKEYEKNGKRYSPSNRVQLEPVECDWFEYTGLKGKNGKEIYEGDTVKGEFFDEDVSDDDYDFTGVVAFRNCEFYCDNADFSLDVYDTLEVLDD